MRLDPSWLWDWCWQSTTLMVDRVLRMALAKARALQ